MNKTEKEYAEVYAKMLQHENPNEIRVWLFYAAPEAFQTIDLGIGTEDFLLFIPGQVLAATKNRDFVWQYGNKKHVFKCGAELRTIQLPVHPVNQ